MQSHFILIDEIYQEYSEQTDAELLPVNVEVLVDIAKNRSNLPISFVSKSWASDLIKGRILRYNNKAIIEYSQRLNPCWQRFVVTKELCHLMFDSEDDYADDIENLVECLVSCNIVRTGVPTPAEASEHMCTIAAAELLTPFKIRRNIHEDYKNKAMTAMQIADIFKVPEHYIEMLLSDPYRDFMDVIHYEVQQKSITS